jgi:hypothetical protein
MVTQRVRGNQIRNRCGFQAAQASASSASIASSDFAACCSLSAAQFRMNASDGSGTRLRRR